MNARRPRTATASALLAAALAFSLPRQPARAEDSVDYKYENYR